ncbi:MAG: hypothetical protein KJ579_09925 [Verrucomicrobia bacterium]|nr:hypothetical protein [Verrucomicrobiota bacterium]
MADTVQAGLGGVEGMSQYFCGKYLHNLDPKRRLTVPSEWRALVGQPEQFFVIPSVGDDRHLYVYPARVMGPKLRNIHNLSMADAQGRTYLRIMGSRSEMLGWDTQGRIRVRDELLAHAGLSSEVLLVGNFEGFELWNPKAWEAVASKMDDRGLLDASKYVGV